ncbi:flagellar hook protein FlgE [Pseudomonas aeruginosa]|nr:flagellar hook protein FlgE [Pseudomonas aeruginosa]
MSFNIGLSGIQAASSGLNVTGNNIANAGTVGFKQSRAEFADVYAASVLGSGSNPQGSGVLLSDVSQMFKQGNIDSTNSVLDPGHQRQRLLRHQQQRGDQLHPRRLLQYRQAGFHRRQQRLPPAGLCRPGRTASCRTAWSPTSGRARQSAPQATSNIQQSYNLNSTLKPPTVTPFDPSDAATYNSSSSLGIYDSQGNSHTMSQFFIKNEPDPNATPPIPENSWTMKVLIDGVNPLDPSNKTPMSFNVTFDASGQMTSVRAPDGSTSRPGFSIDATTNVIQFSPATGNPPTPGTGWIPAASDGKTPPTYAWNGATGAASGISFDMRKTTQYSTAFAQSNPIQDGYTTGQLAGLEIDDTGVIFARYTNGQSKVQGQVVLANFANIQGLTPIGKTSWVQSSESGEPAVGAPRSGTLGRCNPARWKRPTWTSPTNW